MMQWCCAPVDDSGETVVPPDNTRTRAMDPGVTGRVPEIPASPVAVEETAPPELTPESTEFTVRIWKDKNQELGVDVDRHAVSGMGCLRVLRLRDTGCFQKHNDECEDATRRVQPGDQIAGINGVTCTGRDVNALVGEAKKCGHLEFQIRRPVST
eukprot:CAMPEP_0204336534 /NCGR_PEP_ID=MMETSP0469-20131031/19605_1 /ASSEMBLY_ACC=CAM_ASM_000384 /TAXON_ID=2969 /ORGANISM="Oxyrrhis marina" /LENGTH=154 /DNA_ID=CAMNT_0051320419 /DNA_START=24 /DNA_END=488 /DNA_ORIENTATION=+